MPLRRSAAFVAALVLSAGAARAEIAETHPAGFRLRYVQTVAVPPARLFQALGEWGRWWSDEHTYSGKAANMTLALKPGGCLCETLPDGGGVQHGQVVMLIPGQVLRLDAPLGPLQDEGVSAALTFVLKPAEGGVQVTTTMNVGGARPDLLKAAPNVDRVLAEGVARLKRYAETGSPK